LLIEEQRTNLLTYSSEFNNAAWVKARSTVTADATTAPDSNLTADKLLEDTTSNSTHFCEKVVSVVSGTSYTFSIYVKAGERTQIALQSGGALAISAAYFNISTGSVISGSGAITAIGNGWYRCSVIGTASSSGNAYIDTFLATSGTASYTGDGTSGLYIWGAQLEAGAFPTSYIPTTSATVTRAADNASMVGSNFSSWYNQSEGTIYCTSDSPLTTTTAQMNWYISDGNTNNTMFNHKNLSNLNATAVVSGGVTQGDITSFSTITSYSTVKSASAYKLNDLAISVNGASVGTDLAATIPTVDRIHLGQNVANGQILNGHIQSIKYYPTRLPNADLQRLTR
jgi:hypothetical protein